MEVEPPSVARRLLAILDAFTADRPALTLSQISRRTGTPLSTTHRLVAEIVRWGGLERDETGAYRIGLRLWEVATLAPRPLVLRDAALPFLEDLYEATHENVQLGVLDGHEVVYVERIAGRHAVNVITRVGGRLPLHATGVGQVLLAHAPADVQEDVLGAPLRRFTDRTIVSPHQLRRVLAEVRRAGWVVCDGQVEDISLSVGAPVHGERNEVVAALSVVVAAEGCDPRRLIPAVCAAARGISRALGAHPPATGPARV